MIGRALRRLVPPMQDTTCSSCWLPIRERRRKPCPRCGDTARIHLRLVIEAMTSVDRTN